MPTQNTISEVTANATARTDKAALRDTRQAARDIASAIEDAETSPTVFPEYHTGQAIGRLEFALTALRAAKTVA